jgi:hypothetical protein
MKIKLFCLLTISLLLGTTLYGCTSAPAQNALQLTETELSTAPSTDMRSFQPVQGTQEDVLAVHADERAKAVVFEITDDTGNPVMTAKGEDTSLKAELFTAAGDTPTQTVQVLRGDEVIFETPAGMPSPALPLQALWTYDGHWALEILLANETTWAGQVFIDGELVNDQKGYDEAFGLQMMAGKPFFFYMRDGHAGYSYDGQETDLEYSQIPHYNCCSESVTNPEPAENMVSFFAQRDGTWYYVELGAFGE